MRLTRISLLLAFVAVSLSCTEERGRKRDGSDGSDTTGGQSDVLGDTPGPDAPGPDAPEPDALNPDAGPITDQGPPTVAFANPQSGETVSGVVSVQVTATDDTGVAQVRYSLNGTPQGEVDTAPDFVWLWDTALLASGNYILSAVALDAAGNLSSPAEIEVQVSNTTPGVCAPPKVNIIYPTKDAEVCGTVSVEAAVSATCDIDVVEMVIDAASSGTDSVAPFRFDWQTTALPDGAHILRVVARDSEGQEAHEVVEVTVNNTISPCDNPPTVAILQPQDGAYVDGVITIEASASDDAAATHVQFSVDGAGLGDDTAFPFKLDWDTSDVDETVHTVRAIAFDTSGKSSQQQIQVVVDRTNPTVSLVSPTAGMVLGGDLVIIAEASDSAALDRVELRVDEVLIGTLTEPPFQATWAASGQASGARTITATAVDRAGHEASTTRTFVLDQPPTIELVTPIGGAALSGVVTVSAKATDPEGIESLVVRIDGQALASAGGANAKVKSLNTPWDTVDVAYGEHVVSAEVTDSSGQKATTSHTISVDQPLHVDLLTCGPNLAGCAVPTVPNVVGTVFFLGLAIDDNATPTEMVFSVDGVAKSTVNTDPFSFTWDSTTVPDGNHTVALTVVTSLGEEKGMSAVFDVSNCDLDYDGYVSMKNECGGNDCNDSLAAIHPDVVDKVDNGIDTNCDGIDGIDKDGDSFASVASGGDDCDDISATTYPGAVDALGDTTDQNCDGVDGIDLLTCSGGETFSVPRAHFVSFSIPPAVTDLDCDSDNSGAIDAKDGELNALLAGTLKSFFDVNGLLATNIAEGDLVRLADLQGPYAGGVGTDLTINMYVGHPIDTDTATCFDVAVTAYDSDLQATATTWDGESVCDYLVNPQSFNTEGCPLTQIPGATVTDGQIEAGPVAFRFVLPLGVIELEVDVETGRFEGAIGPDFRVTDGRICGQVPFASLKQAFEDVCAKDPQQQFCSFKGIALPIIEGECKKSGDVNCTFSLAFETAKAGKLTVTPF